ncbi:glycosyltransferase [Galbitalea soli]|uniref:glycosyltransferase n=1 Tax=Galbitalea soli TaxID=1268042 RepID=UPI0017ADAC09|nr:dolichol-phosphate mannosyltransferase [Galbitalea soli]
MTPSDTAATGAASPVAVSVVVPTFNESGNVVELVRRIRAATVGMTAEIIFVDDSTDETPAVIAAIPDDGRVPVRLLHRVEPTGGLGGAVIAGMRAAAHDWVQVMDGDLQHPPEMIPVMAAAAGTGLADIVIASRYRGEGEAAGLSSPIRHLVSQASTLLTRAMFPSRMRDCTDPMTGFFLVHRPRVAIDRLQPRGFKILLEILVRQPHRMRVLEEPFSFGRRFAGESKASVTQGVRFLRQLMALRFGRASAFAVIGVIGALANLAIVWLLTSLGMEYLIAAAIAAEVTIIANFILQEHFVFHDLLHGASHWRVRFAKSVIFNNVEAAVRIPVLYVMVTLWGIAAVPATAVTLALAFVVRFTYHSRVIYAPGRTPAAGTVPVGDEDDDDSDLPVIRRHRSASDEA